MQIGILEPYNFSQKVINILKKIGNVTLFDENKNDLDSFLNNLNIIFIRLKHQIDKNFLKNTPFLKYICTPTTGLNHLNLDEIAKKNITVISLKGEQNFLKQIRATPENAFGLTLSLIRNYKEAFLNENNKKWDRDKYRGYELYENKVGIIGLGRVGKILAKYFKCFGSKVYFYDINKSIKSFQGCVRLKSIEEVINNTNIVLLCADYNKKNKQFFSKKYIDLLKDKYFINISRGELVEEDYLIEKIEKNHFKGVALDVISNETNKNNRMNDFIRLTKNRNFILTPHISGATFDSMGKTEEFIARKLVDIINPRKK